MKLWRPDINWNFFVSIGNQGGIWLRQDFVNKMGNAEVLICQWNLYVSQLLSNFANVGKDEGNNRQEFSLIKVRNS